MRDFNFFRSYQKSKGKAASFKRNSVMAVVLALALMGGAYGFNIYRMNLIHEDMKRMEKYIYSPENIKKHQVFLKSKERLAILTSYFQAVQKVNGIIEGDSKITLAMMAQLGNAMPVNSALQSVKINSKGIELQGAADERIAVADLEHNLIQTGLFKDVFVTHIDVGVTGTGGTGRPMSRHYLFAIKCEMKEVVKP